MCLGHGAYMGKLELDPTGSGELLRVLEQGPDSGKVAKDHGVGGWAGCRDRLPFPLQDVYGADMADSSRFPEVPDGALERS